MDCKLGAQPEVETRHPSLTARRGTNTYARRCLLPISVLPAVWWMVYAVYLMKLAIYLNSLRLFKVKYLVATLNNFCKKTAHWMSSRILNWIHKAFTHKQLYKEPILKIEQGLEDSSFAQLQNWRAVEDVLYTTLQTDFLSLTSKLTLRWISNFGVPC